MGGRPPPDPRVVEDRLDDAVDVDLSAGVGQEGQGDPAEMGPEVHLGTDIAV